MDKIKKIPIKRIHNPKGDIFPFLKKSDDFFQQFGEAYFSTVKKNEIKGWKKHTVMQLNITVISGEILFVIYHEINREFEECLLSRENYCKLIIPSGNWVAFKGLGNDNVLLNIANIEHDPTEAINLGINEINYDWS